MTDTIAKLVRSIIRSARGLIGDTRALRDMLLRDLDITDGDLETIRHGIDDLERDTENLEVSVDEYEN